MSISSISGSGSNDLLMGIGKSIQEQLAEMQEKAQEALQEAPSQQTLATIPQTADNGQFSGGSVDMSGMYAHSGNGERSKYIEGFFSGNSQLKQLQQAFNSSMASIAATLRGENSLSETAGMRRAKHMQQVYEASQVNLDEIKQDIEMNVKETQAEAKARAQAEARAAQERQIAQAMAPKDENGQPIEQLAPEISSARNGQPMPEIASGSADVDIDIAPKQLEARNISINIKPHTVKVDVKV